MIFDTRLDELPTIGFEIDDDYSHKDYKSLIKKIGKEIEELFINDHFPYCPECDEKEINCICPESEVDVAWGLGFSIDDDGHWVPIEDNDYGYYSFESYPRDMTFYDQKDSPVDVEIYNYFVVL